MDQNPPSLAAKFLDIEKVLFISLIHTPDFRCSDADLNQKESFQRVFSNEKNFLLPAASTIIIMRGLGHSLCTRTSNSSVNIMQLSVLSTSRTGTEYTKPYRNYKKHCSWL